MKSNTIVIIDLHPRLWSLELNKKIKDENLNLGYFTIYSSEEEKDLIRNDECESELFYKICKISSEIERKYIGPKYNQNIYLIQIGKYKEHEIFREVLKYSAINVLLTRSITVSSFDISKISNLYKILDLDKA